MNRKLIFDAVKTMLARSFTPAEVKALDKAIDDAMRGTGEIMAGAKQEWITLAAPLVERFEGMARLIPGNMVEAYPDPGTGGEPWTIGVGSTTDENGMKVRKGDRWPVERARKRFEAHLEEFGRGVDLLLAGKPTTAHQKAALTSWAYNVGLGNVSSSTLLKKHRAGDYAGAAAEFTRWNRAAGKVMAGLTRRREAEAALYRGQA